MDAARQAIETHIAKPLKLSLEDAAAGMYHMMNINMAAGLREITVSRGIDPREYPLVVAGGARRRALIAEGLEIPIVLVPKESSIFCASGMLRSDFKHSYVRTYHALSAQADPEADVAVLRRDGKGRPRRAASRESPGPRAGACL